MLTVADVERHSIEALLGRYGLALVVQAGGERIRGSYWGDPEAGIVGHSVYCRGDTPLHSLLHETAHIVCMSPVRRAGLDRDAGSDDREEAAVCYLQILLADELDGVGRTRVMRDMDAWGYSFPSGSTASWFDADAADAREWLLQKYLILPAGGLPFRLRE